MKKILLAMPLLLACTGCFNVENKGGSNRTIEIDEGRVCRVEIRRDAIGMASEQGVGLGTDVMNDQTLSLFGKVKRMDATWIVLDAGDSEEWIPVDAVLRIQVD